MEIKDFTNPTVRLGNFPFCIDVSSIPGYYSGNGVMCATYLYNYPDETCKPHIVLIKDATRPAILHLLVLEWEEQWNKLSEEIRNGEILYDSASKGE